MIERQRHIEIRVTERDTDEREEEAGRRKK